MRNLFSRERLPSWSPPNRETCHLAFFNAAREIFRFKKQSAPRPKAENVERGVTAYVTRFPSARARVIFPSLFPSGDDRRSLTETKLEIWQIASAKKEKKNNGGKCFKARGGRQIVVQIRYDIPCVTARRSVSPVSSFLF